MNNPLNQENENSEQQQNNAPQQTNAPLPSNDLTRAKNPNPRANENIDNGMIDTGSTNDVGSEITDGEAG